MHIYPLHLVMRAHFSKLLLYLIIQQTLQECVKTFTSNQSAPLDAWYEEMTAGMDALIQQNKGLKKEVSLCVLSVDS